MHEILSGYKDYKAMMGGVSIGVMLVMAVQMMRRMPNVPVEQRGAYKLYTIYLIAGVVMVGIFMLGYIYNVR